MQPETVDGVLYGADFPVMVAVARRLGVPGFKNYAALGIVRGGEVIGGVVFHDFSGHDIEVTLAVDGGGWLKRSMLRRLLLYPFVQLGCIRASAMTPEDNRSARRLLDKLGAEPEGRHPGKFGPDTVGISYGLRPERCRWLGALA